MAEKSTLLIENLPETAAQQTCVKAVFYSSLPTDLKKEAYKFIERNLLEDCQRVPPNCLKAHLIKTAKKLSLSNKVNIIKKLFKSDIGYEGYYLDSGKLRRV